MPDWDFNGDGREDILWRSSGGRLSNWLGSTTGLIVNDSVAMTHVPLSWYVLWSGDFNGDGRSDILWRNTDGRISNWLGTEAGGFIANDSVAMRSAAANWYVIAVADVNGDDRDDLIWTSADHRLSTWLATDQGGFTVNDAAAMRSFAPGWSALGTGDFNGDGNDDLLWGRPDAGGTAVWYGTTAGGFTVPDFVAPASPYFAVYDGIGDFNGDGYDDVVWRRNDQTGIAYGQDSNTLRISTTTLAAPADWTILGVGDFDGDGLDDILWRNDDGRLSNWLGTDAGTFIVNDAVAMTGPVSWNWAYYNIADYNGDGRDDIFWRNEVTGAVSTWLATEGGGWQFGTEQPVAGSWSVESSLSWWNPWDWW